MLSPGEVIGSYTLLNQLNDLQYIPSWRVRGADGQSYVLRILPGVYTHDKHDKQWMTGYDGTPRAFETRAELEQHFIQQPGKYVEQLMALPEIPGLAPLLGYEIIEYDDTISFAIKRRYYPERLTDRFPANAANPPEKSLLEMFASLATTLDSLHQHLPKLDFDLAPGDLLLNGYSPIIADYGLSQYNNYMDFNNRMWSSRVEHEGKRSLVGLYANKENFMQTEPQFALAALYVYIRSRFMIFEDTVTLYPTEKDILKRMNWVTTIFENHKIYRNTGRLPLGMLTNDREREIIAKALAREPGEAYESCAAFVRALGGILR